MNRFQQMRVFVAVAEEQGFAAAARRLQTSPPAVTRSIAALEEDLGVPLLIRTTRSVRVTEPGRRYLEDARQILGAVQAADQTAAGINSAPRGHLGITAPMLFGRKFVMPGVVDYLNKYPETEVETLFVDRVVNLIEEGLDVGIRIGELPDSSLRAIRVGSVRWMVVASPDYLANSSEPESPEGLQAHTLIASSAGDFSLSWRFAGGIENKIRIKPRLMTTTNDSAIEATLQGFGIVRLLSYQVADEIKHGQLKRILQSFEPEPLPIHIVHREGKYASARIRAFIDLLAERLRSRLVEQS